LPAPTTRPFRLEFADGRYMPIVGKAVIKARNATGI
jgi:hypothetical protein